jgi:hypothetical protein
MTDVSQPNARDWVRKASAAIAQLPDWILLTIEGWRQRSRLRSQLDYLHQCGEFDRTLTDSGIAFCDVPRLMRMHPLTLQLIDEMMQRQGIDRAALPPARAGTHALREIEWQCGACADWRKCHAPFVVTGVPLRSCGACADWRKCHAWLTSHDAQESCPAFCSNAEVFDQLRRAEAAASGSSI